MLFLVLNGILQYMMIRIGESEDYLLFFLDIELFDLFQV